MLEEILGALLPAVITILLGYFAARHEIAIPETASALMFSTLGSLLTMSVFIWIFF